MPATNTPTTRQLLDLKPGARLTVELRSGRRYSGTLKRAPRLVQAGKPGIHRVRLDVTDTDAVAGLSDRAGVLDAMRCTHTIPGHKVISID